jgi:hypothetical protein
LSVELVHCATTLARCPSGWHEERRIAIARNSQRCGMLDENCFTEANFSAIRQRIVEGPERLGNQW